MLGGLIAYGLGKHKDGQEKRVVVSGDDTRRRFVGVDRDSESVKNVSADLCRATEHDDRPGGGSGGRDKLLRPAQRC